MPATKQKPETKSAATLLRFDREVFSAAFAVAEKFAAGSTPHEILEWVRLEVAQGRAVLTASDGEQGLRYVIPDAAPTALVATVLLRPHYVSEILGSLKERVETIEIEITAAGATLRAGSSRWSLCGRNPDGFIEPALFPGDAWYTVAADEFAEILRRAAIAADSRPQTDTAYATHCVELLAGDEEIVARATDRLRLVSASAPCRASGSPSWSAALLPVRSATRLAGLLASLGSEECCLALAGGDLVAECGPVTASFRLGEGFPIPFERAIPPQAGVTVALPVGPLLATIRQAATVTTRQDRCVTFAFGRRELVLCAADGKDCSRIRLPIEFCSKEISLSLNPRRVAQVLDLLDPGQLVGWSLVDGGTAVVLRAGERFVCAIAPLREE